MDSEPARDLMGLSALAGAAVTGLWTFYMAVAAPQPLTGRDYVRLAVKVVAGILAGGLVAYYLGPIIASYLPAQIGADPRAVGFGVGFVAWGAIPVAEKFARDALDWLATRLLSKEKP